MCVARKQPSGEDTKSKFKAIRQEKKITTVELTFEGEPPCEEYQQVEPSREGTPPPDTKRE